VHRRVIAPLRLRDTYLAGTTERIRGPHSQGYIPWFEGELRAFTDYNMSWAWMLGDLVSTTEDLNTFFRALLTGRLLRPAQLAQMKTTVAAGGAGYGLGLYTLQLPCGEVWGHDGLTFGYSMISLHTPDGSRQISIGQNMTHFALGPNPIDEAVGQLLFQELCPGSSLRQAYVWESPVHANKTW
jgi:D-alanyl-D-alanine carboxypeptidase